jgi:hypothetical protein
MKFATQRTSTLCDTRSTMHSDPKIAPLMIAHCDHSVVRCPGASVERSRAITTITLQDYEFDNVDKGICTKLSHARELFSVH